MQTHQTPRQTIINAATLAHIEKKAPQQYPPLALEARTHVNTEHCAYLLGRQSQTLRVWAMKDGTGPLRPVRVNGRLAWPVSEIKRVLGVA